MGQGATQELKRGGVIQWLSLVAFVTRNWFWGWTFFLPSFILDLAAMFTSAAIFYLMGQLVAGGAEEHVASYGLGYGSYIVTGVMFNQVMVTTLRAFHGALVRGYWATQFDTYLQHPGGVSAYLTGELIVQYFVSSLSTAVYLLVGIWLFRVVVVVANLLDVLAVLALAVIALAGLGLAGASTFALLNAKGWTANPVEWLVGFGVTLLAGVYFPPTVLPEWLQQLGEWLPQTHALRAARLCLGGQATLADPRVTGDILFLLQFAAVALPLGALLFLAGIRKAERDGTLTRWT